MALGLPQFISHLPEILSRGPLHLTILTSGHPAPIPPRASSVLGAFTLLVPPLLFRLILLLLWRPSTAGRHPPRACCLPLPQSTSPALPDSKLWALGLLPGRGLRAGGQGACGTNT